MITDRTMASVNVCTDEKTSADSYDNVGYDRNEIHLSNISEHVYESLKDRQTDTNTYGDATFTNNDNPKVNKATKRSKMPRWAIVLLMILLCVLTSAVTGVILYHVTTAKLANKGSLTTLQQDNTDIRAELDNLKEVDVHVKTELLLLADKFNKHQEVVVHVKTELLLLADKFNKYQESASNNRSDTLTYLADMDRQLDNQEHAIQGLLEKLNSSKQAGCREGWVPYKGSCYHAGRATLRWGDAALMCRIFGGYLAEISDAEENSFVHNLIKAVGTSAIGVNDLEEEGKWLWLTGQPISYSNWAPGEPGRNGEHVGTMYHQNGKWNDVPIGHSANYVCESDFQ